MVDFDLEDNQDFDDGCEDVELESVDLEVKRETDVIYPSVLIDSIESEEEFRFFHNRGFGREEQAIPLYCYVDDNLTLVGKFELSVDSLLAVRAISDYDVYLMLSKDKHKQIDLDNPETMLKFVKL